MLDDEEDITVKMKVGVILSGGLLSEPQKPRDPMRCMISDAYPIGMQLLDPNHDYTTGPYKPVGGESQKRKLKVDTTVTS